MHRVLIVDDEVLIRQGIKTLLEWESYDYKIVGEAADGEEAIKMISETKPDVIFTDLIMEPLDGFELIKYVKEHSLAIDIVVLSNNNDFDNVRKAMKMGAIDYIFKLSLSKEKLLSILLEIAQSTTNHDIDISIINKYRTVIASEILRKFIQKKYITTGVVLEELRKINFKCNFSKRYRFYLLSIDNYKLAVKKSVFKDVELLSYSIENVIREIMGNCGENEIITYGEGEYLLVSNVDTDLSNNCSSQLIKNFEELNKSCNIHFGLNISCAGGNIYCKISDLYQAYKDTKEVLDSRFYNGPGFYTERYKLVEIQKKEQNPMLILEFLSNKILNTLIDYFDIEVKKHMKSSTVGEIREDLRKIHSIIDNYFHDKGIDISNIRNENDFNLLEIIDGCDSIEQIMKELYAFMSTYYSLDCEKRTQHQRKEIIIVKEYIHNNAKQEITVAKMANYVNMSESYFSHIFKKETGESFISYVNRIKIEEAKRLLLTSNCRINEVGYEVGYMNPVYFSQLFKKITGLSPSEFINNNT